MASTGIRLILLAVLPLAACGYGLVRPSAGEGEVFSVPVAVNTSSWLGLEVALTEAVRRDLQRLLDVRLDDERPAQWTLRTEITDVGRRSRLALRSGGASVGISLLEIEWKLENAQGEALTEGRIRRNLEFLTSLQEDSYTAFEEILAEISQQIALEVGASLEEASKPPQQA